ncbi:MAG: hypothetical protein ABTQ34_04065 [Bdellovibrionales bacterium]
MSLPRKFFDPSFRHRHLGGFFSALVGIMVFLATFATAAEATLSAVTLTWDRGMREMLTVEIPAVEDESSMPQEERVRQTLAILRAIPDIAKATPLPEKEAMKLLSPWIRSQELLKTLPIPALIDVERRPGSGLLAEDIRRKIQAAASDARVDDHAEWIKDLTRFVDGLTIFGGVMIVLTGLTLAIAVSLLCRAVMVTERETVTLLHSMGAEDSDIARHFEHQARRLAIPASLAGFMLAIPCAGLCLYFLRHFADASLLPALHWVGLAFAVILVPVGAMVIAAISARVSAQGFLRAMP